jgi:hypothetical protein
MYEELNDDEYEEINEDKVLRIVDFMEQELIHPINMALLSGGMYSQVFLLDKYQEFQTKNPTSMDKATEEFHDYLKKLRALIDLVVAQLELNTTIPDDDTKSIVLIAALSKVVTGVCPLLTGEELEEVLGNIGDDRILPLSFDTGSEQIIKSTDFLSELDDFTKYVDDLLNKPKDGDIE